MNTKYKVISVVSLVIGLIAGILALAPHNGQSTPSLNGTYDVNNASSLYTNGVDYGNVPTNINYVGGKIGAKSNIAYYKNISGGTQYVENVEVSTDNFASSTFKIYAFSTTTAPRAIFDFATPGQGASTTVLINGFTFATSSTATTTSSDDNKGFTALAGTVAILPANGYVIVQMQAAGPACPSTAGQCESATSSNRGFNLQWRAMVHN